MEVSLPPVGAISVCDRRESDVLHGVPTNFRGRSLDVPEASWGLLLKLSATLTNFRYFLRTIYRDEALNRTESESELPVSVDLAEDLPRRSILFEWNLLHRMGPRR